MGSSLLLRTGSSKQKSMTESLTQSAHGFAIGTVLRYNAATSKYIRAKADSATNAEVVGVVSEIADADSFTLTYGGQVDISSLSTLTAPVLFLSGTTAGEATINPPSAIGTVIKPILAKNSASAGYVFINYLGTQIGGSSTVAIDQIQPVGCIIPYAGSVIPETWLACDGGSYAISGYAELYTKLQYTTGSRMPMYGYVVEIQLSGGSSTIWNNTAVGDAFITNSGESDPTRVSYEIIGKVLSKTATTITGSYPLTVQVYPNYNDTTKNFIFPNKVPFPSAPPRNGGSVLTFSSAAGIEPVVAVANGTVRTGSGLINTVSVIAFNTPDLRSRFPIGSGRTTRLEDQETNNDWFTSVGANYTLGSMGGQESNRTTAVAATGTAVFVPFQATGAGSIANIPPYVATQYIIKAKPYTRAAIIDGVDIPYDQLLVRNMKTRVLGGSNSSLELYTNTAGDGGSGTQRMCITTSGLVGIGTVSPSALLEISGTNASPHLMLRSTTENTLPEIRFMETTSSSWALVGSCSSSGANGTFCIRDDYQNGTPVRLAITNLGMVGIGTTGPTVRLQVKSSSAEVARLETTVARGSGQNYLGFRDPTGLKGYVGYGSNSSDSIGLINLLSAPLYLGTNGTVRTTITADGSVGIGTQTPTVALDVVGDVKTSTKFVGNGTIPIGGIIMWSGTSVPTGWAFCDGTTVSGTVTPDLRNKFIISRSAGTLTTTIITGAATSTGGTKDTILPDHRHNFIMDDNIGAQTAIDSFGVTRGSKINGNGASGAGDLHVYTSSLPTTSTTASVTTQQNNGIGTNGNLPPYYALAYIMRVS